MGNLSSILPTETETVQRIYDWHKTQGDAEPTRGYLGASILGHHCDRFLWYTFRGCVARQFEGRLYRLFETGDLAEARFTTELQAIGCEVQSTGEDGEQFEVNSLGGHVSGHLDGAALGIPEAPKTWHVCEFKTHNAKSHKALVDKGVKLSKPMHYAQMQIYMGLTGMTRALYLAVNKDTDHLYSERVRYDPKAFKALMDRAKRIITTHTPPERYASRPDDWQCKFCDAYQLCWGGGEDAAVPIPLRNCRTCCHATAGIFADDNSAPWSCAKSKQFLTPVEQAQGCDKHLLLPGLVGFADTCDAGDDWIEFVNQSDGAHWRHGQGKGMWSTKELMRTPGPAVGEKTVQAAKDVFGGTVERLPLIQQYCPGDSERLWDGMASEIGQGLEGLGLSEIYELPPTRQEEHEGVKYTEFCSVGGGRDILIAIDIKSGYAGILEGKK